MTGPARRNSLTWPKLVNPSPWWGDQGVLRPPASSASSWIRPTPLAELTHKRRVRPSAQAALTRERPGLLFRDIHRRTTQGLSD